MDLELSSARSRDVEWPATPDLQPVLEPRGAAPRAAWPLVARDRALAAVAAAFAVPQSRGAILRFFHLGAATIELVDTLPQRGRAAARRPASAGRSRSTAARTRFPDAAPAAARPHSAAASLRAGRLVPLPYRRRAGAPERVPSGARLPEEARRRGTTVDAAAVRRRPALWVSGAATTSSSPAPSPRLAGNVLALGGRTAPPIASKARSLTKDEAVSLARSLTRG